MCFLHYIGTKNPATNRHFIEISRFSDTPVSIFIRSVFFPEFSDFFIDRSHKRIFMWSISQNVSQFSQNVSQNVLWDLTKLLEIYENSRKTENLVRATEQLEFTWKCQFVAARASSQDLKIYFSFHISYTDHFLSNGLS